MRDKIRISDNAVIVPHATDPSEAEEIVAKFIQGGLLEIIGQPEAHESGGYSVPVKTVIQRRSARWGTVIRPDDAQYGQLNKDAY